MIRQKTEPKNKYENDRMGMLTINSAGGAEPLAVFGFPEEAEAFLRLGGAPGTGWRVRRTAAGELISVLYGPCIGVKKVALDPPPAPDSDMLLNFVSLDRERFVRNLTGTRAFGCAPKRALIDA